MAEGTIRPAPVTAASNSDNSWLWMSDLHTLEEIRKVTEEVVVDIIERAGRENLRNGTDPNEYITDGDVRKFVEVGLFAWQSLEQQALDNLPLSNYPFSAFDATLRSAIRQASQLFRSIVIQLVIRTVAGTKTYSPPLFGEFIAGQIVQGGDVRPILTSLGGGSNDPTSPQGTGLSLGVIFLDWLNANGLNSQQKIWQYGPVARRNFEGHRQLDGLIFTSWQDDRLLVRPEDAWIKASYYSNSDHYGCRCITSLYIP